MKRLLPILFGLALISFPIGMVGCSTGSGTNASSTAATSPTSNVNAAEAQTAMKELAGTWDMIEAERFNGSDTRNQVDEDTLNLWRDDGYDISLVLNEDGTATFLDRNRNEYGTWEMDNKNSGYIILDDLGYDLSFENSKLTLSAGALFKFTFAKSSDTKNPVSQADYETARSAFVGKWTITSATRDGMTITKDAGQIPAELTIELKDDMKYDSTYDDDSTEGRWGITDSNSGYLDSPSSGTSIWLEDDLLILDTGESGTLAFVRE